MIGRNNARAFLARSETQGLPARAVSRRVSGATLL